MFEKKNFFVAPIFAKWPIMVKFCLKKKNNIFLIFLALELKTNQRFFIQLLEVQLIKRINMIHFTYNNVRREITHMLILKLTTLWITNVSKNII